MLLKNSPQNSVQVGGSHYKELKTQVWDFIIDNNIPYMEGNIIKYVTRWQDKGGIDDLKKARHYLDKLIEICASAEGGAVELTNDAT